MEGRDRSDSRRPISTCPTPDRLGHHAGFPETTGGDPRTAPALRKELPRAPAESLVWLPGKRRSGVPIPNRIDTAGASCYL